jgi:hypothetical protein
MVTNREKRNFNDKAKKSSVFIKESIGHHNDQNKIPKINITVTHLMIIHYIYKCYYCILAVVQN